jgi:hypothetical protein
MPSKSASLSLVVAETATRVAATQVAIAATTARVIPFDLAVAAPLTVETGLSAVVGPVAQPTLDVLIAEGHVEPIALDVVVGPAVFSLMNTHIGAVGIERTTDLSPVIAQTFTKTVGLSTSAAIVRETFVEMLVALADQNARTTDLDCAIADGTTVCVFPKLSVLVAEQRSHAVPLQVLIDTGLLVGLDVAILATEQLTTDVEVYVTSADVKIGASAVLNCDGDEIELTIAVQDATVPRPDLIDVLTATLEFRNQHLLGTVTVGPEHAAGGVVQGFWVHPAHVSELTVRIAGIVRNIGTVDFTIPVMTETPNVTLATRNPLDTAEDPRPRVATGGSTARTIQLDPAPEEIEVLDEGARFVLFDLDLTDENYLRTGVGPIAYQGGGNRLLASLDDDGTYVVHDVDVLPVEIGAHTRVESDGQNLLDNSDLLTPASITNAVPAGWTLTSSSSVTVMPAVETDESTGLGILRIHAFGSGNYTGPKKYRLESVSVAASPGPMTLAVLARIEYAPLDETAIPTDVTIEDMRVTMSFRNASDDEISQQIVTFSPADLQSPTMTLLTNVVPLLPVACTAVRAVIELESIETTDVHSLYLMAPQLQPTAFVTSPIVGETAASRAADVLRFPQQDNLEIGRGSIRLGFAAGYAGTPAADVCLFDTRSDAGINGYAGYHLTDGRLRFIIAGPAGDHLVESTPVSFGLGVLQDVAFSWGLGVLSIHHGDQEVAQDASAVALPTSLNPWVYCFQTTSGLDRLDGELQTVVIRRDLVT